MQQSENGDREKRQANELKPVSGRSEFIVNFRFSEVGGGNFRALMTSRSDERGH